MSSDEKIIDMVQRPDGSWGPRDSYDPYFFVTPNLSEPTPIKPPPPSHVDSSLHPEQTENTVSREDLLNGLEIKGKELSILINTPRGQKEMEYTENDVRRLVDDVMEERRPDPNWLNQNPALSESLKNFYDSQMQKWNELKEARVGELMAGEKLNSKEGDVYLRSNYPVFKPGEINNPLQVILIERFQNRIYSAAYAREYQKELKKPEGERIIPKGCIPLEKSLKDNTLIPEDVRIAFESGWNSVQRGSVKEAQSI